MKLATLQDGTRDGQLAVVARDLKSAHLADGIAPTLQAALDDWSFIAPQLNDLYQLLNGGRAAKAFEFDPARCMAPLPRAFQRVDGAAYPPHEALVRPAPGGFAAESDAPRMLQCAGDPLLSPREDIELAHVEWGLDLGPQLAVVTGDVAQGATPDLAEPRIYLVMLVNCLSLRNLAMHEAAADAAPLQSQAAAACAPVALTPDELGEDWRAGRLHLPLRVNVNGKLLGQPHAGSDMAFSFPQLVAHLCKSRPARAGTIVGSGTVANRDAKRGSGCIAEQRARAAHAGAESDAPYLQVGDTLRIEVHDGVGKSLFGAIEQAVVAPARRPGR